MPRAWEIGAGGALDPGWYDYPSLLIYLLSPFEAFADEPSYLVGRLVVAALGVAGVSRPCGSAASPTARRRDGSPVPPRLSPRRTWSTRTRR